MTSFMMRVLFICMALSVFNTSVSGEEISTNELDSQIMSTSYGYDFEEWMALIDSSSQLDEARFKHNFYDGVQSLIHIYAENSDSRYLAYLITKDVDVKLVNDAGNTALHIAAEHEQKDNIQLLVENGVPLDAINKKGLTAIEVAESQGHDSIVQLLRNLGALDSSLSAHKSSISNLDWDLSYAQVEGKLNKMALNNEATRLAVLSNDSKRLDVYEPTLRVSIGTVTFDTSIEGLSFNHSKDELYLFSKKQLYIYSSSSLEYISTLALPIKTKLIALHPSGESLAISDRFSLQALDLETGQFSNIENKHYVNFLGFSDSGESLFVAGLDGIAVFKKSNKSLEEKVQWQYVSSQKIQAAGYQIWGEQLLVQKAGNTHTSSTMHFSLFDDTASEVSKFTTESVFFDFDARIQVMEKYNVFLLESHDQIVMISDKGQFQKIRFEPHTFSDFIFHPKLGYLIMDESKLSLIDKDGFVRFKLTPGENWQRPKDFLSDITVSVELGLLTWSDGKKTVLPGLNETSLISSLDINDNFLALGHLDGSYAIWELKGAADKREAVLVQNAIYFNGSVSSIKLSPSNKNIFLGSLGRIAMLSVGENVEKRRKLMFRGHDSEVNTLEITTNEKILISSAADNSLRFWSTNDGRLIHVEHFTNAWLDRLELESDSQVLHGSGPGIKKISMNLVHMQKLLENPLVKLSPQTASTSSVGKIVYNPSGTQMANIDDVTVRIWDVKTGLLLNRLFPRKGAVNDLVYTKDGNSLILAAGDKLEYWDPYSGLFQKQVNLVVSGGSIHQIDRFSDTNVLLASNQHGWHEPLFLHSNTGEEIGRFNYNDFITESDDTVIDLAISPSDKLLAVYGGRNIRVFERKGTGFDYELLLTIPRDKPNTTNQYWRNYIGFSPDEKRLHYISFVDDNYTVVYNLERKEEELRVKGKLATFIDNSTLVYMANNTLLKKYNLDNKIQSTMLGKVKHKSLISILSFNPASERLTSADIWGSTITWNPKSGSQVGSSNNFDSDVYTAEVNADGRFFAYTNKKGLHIYDLKHLEHHRLKATNYPYFGAFSRDGKKFYYRDKAQYYVLNLPDMTPELLFTTPWTKGNTSSTKLSSNGESLYFDHEDEYFIYDLSSNKLDATVKKTYPEGRLTISSIDTENRKVKGHLIKSKGENKAALRLVEYEFSDMAMGSNHQWQTLSSEITYDLGDEINKMVTMSDLSLTQLSKNGDYYVYSERHNLKVKHLPSGEILFDRYRNNISHVTFDDHSEKLVIADELGYLEVFDLKNNLILARFKAIDAKISSLNIAGNFITVLGDNEVVNLFTLDNLKLIVSLAPRGDEDILILNSDEYYYATQNGAQMGVAFRKGFNVYPFEQFDLKFNRPDKAFKPLVDLGITSPALVKSYAKAYSKRLSRHGLTQTEMLGIDSTSDLPDLFVKEDERTSDTEQQELNLQYTAISKYSDLIKLNVWVNNVPIHGAKGILLEGKEAIGNVDIPLSKGQNKIQLSAINNAGLESLRYTTNIYKDSKEISKTHVIVIGASEYLDESMNLAFAAKDAIDIGQSLKADNLIQLTNQEVTRDNVRKLKPELMKTSVNDQVILFYAGHGLLTEDLDYYLATYDIDFLKPASKGLDFATLEYLFDGIPARNRLMFIDACHSGEADQSENLALQVLAQNNTDITVNDFVSARGLDTLESGSDNRKIQHLGLDSSFELSKHIFSDIRKGTGITVISASGSAEFAYEFGDLNNGVFTYSILEGLKENKADENHDETVTVTELQHFVRKRVVEITQGLQQPTYRTENLENDWPLKVNE